MKRLTLVVLSIFLSFVFVVNTTYAYVSVSGYYRSNGTYVAPYVRSNPNGLKYDNYSYTPSQGLYNKTYGTRGTYWDTPTYITDPNYYLGKSIYDSGNSSSYSSYSSNSYYPTTPTCPMNSYYDGVSSCQCNYGYVVSGGSCVSANSMCWNKLGYSSSYDSVSNSCKCDSGYVIGNYGQCVSGNSWCSSQMGVMSEYNRLSNKCQCISGYEFDGVSCVYKDYNTKSYSGYNQSSYNSYNCPLNSHVSQTDTTKCQCDTGYQVNSTKSSCIPIATDTNNQSCINSFGSNSYWNGTRGSNGGLNCSCQNGYNWNSTLTACVISSNSTSQNNQNIGVNYYISNHTCVGLTGDQYGDCVSYAYNH